MLPFKSYATGAVKPDQIKRLFVIVLLFIHHTVLGQELYVSTEPASNMAKGSIGLRLNSRVFKMNYNQRYNAYRLEPEVMLGVNKNTMVHFAAYASNMFQDKFRFEGASFYGKYRFFSRDDIHKHFRLAAFAKGSLINNPEVLLIRRQNLLPDGNGGFVTHEDERRYQSNDIDLDGNNSGLASGVIATGLINKLALSASLGYAYRMNNMRAHTESFQSLHAVTYSVSAGYLLFPKEYTSYHQTNCNLYFEMLGQTFPDKRQSFVDAAPAVQFIFNSIARVDLAYRTQIEGNVKRLGSSSFMVRLEYNFLNVFAKK